MLRSVFEVLGEGEEPIAKVVRRDRHWSQFVEVTINTCPCELTLEQARDLIRALSAVVSEAEELI